MAAESSGGVFMNALRAVGRRVNPVNIAHNLYDRVTNHPIQTGVSTLLGLVNPALGAAARTGFDRYNTSQFQESAGQLLADTQERLNNQIWGTQDAAPTGMPSNAGSGGNMGNMGGMWSMGGGVAGITSPMQGNYSQPSQQGELAQLLGLNNYNGDSPGNGLQGITSPLATEQPPADSGGSNDYAGYFGPSGATVTHFGGNPGGGGFNGGPSFGYSGDTASGAHGTIGSGARQASMEGVQAMLGAGLGKRPLMPFHEINDERAQARAAGMSLAQYRASLGA